MARKERTKPSGDAPKSKKDRKEPAGPAIKPQAQKELVALAILALAVISALAFFHAAGPFGDFLDRGLAALFGYDRYLLPIILGGTAGRLVFPDRFRFERAAGLGLFLFLTGWGGFLNLVRFPAKDAMLTPANIAQAGGYFGLVLSYPLLATAGVWAGGILLALVTFAALILIFNVSLHELAASVMGLRHRMLPWPIGHKDGEPLRPEMIAAKEEDAPLFTKKTLDDHEEPGHGENAAPEDGTAPTEPRPPRRKRMKAISIPVDILTVQNAKPNSGDIHGRQMSIQKTLENFGIPVEMGELSVGPTVTQFTLKPAEGIKLSRITSLSNDLALTLAAHPIRIEAPIPGRSLVGIEVPNQVIATVGMREILESREFKTRKNNLTICLGKDVSGKPWIADLGKMPHLLVAGATGSGKTVCLNAIILSLLYQNHPDDLKLMLIDPKRVELPVYNGIPHLLTPAITEVPKTINALKWAISEMDRRFTKLSESGKRDIASYNESAEEKMPYLVIIIDELADLMVASASEVETSIIRLAQMSRAVGIHLVVATQRPSVDVITGLIKANITSRIAFSVASSTDSRTILDSPGAEKLVGRGDMLFLSAELSKPKRIQCCYVSDGDIRRVVDYIKGQLEEPVTYEEGVTEKNGGANRTGGGFGDGDDDELYDEARDIIVKAGKASASYLQRRLSIGYARAARLLDLLEERGIIGPGEGAKPRTILATPVRDEDGLHFSENDDADEEG